MPRQRHDPPRGLLNLDPSSGPVQLQRLLPTSDLAHTVEHYWSVRWDLRGQPQFTSETLPYPSVHLVLEDASWRLTGVQTRRFERTLTESGGVFGIKFTPGGLRPLLNGSVAELTDRTVEAEPLLPWVADLPRDALRPLTESIERTERVLRGRLGTPDERATRVYELVQAIVGNRGILRVEQLVDSSGLSERALQRLFREYVGVSPKWVIQRYRLFEAADRLANGSADGAQVAHELGYFDQAHFIRDFTSMVGRSPGAFAAARRVA